MTTYKTVVSWLAFLFLAYRGSLLTLAWLLDRWGIKPIPEFEIRRWQMGPEAVTINDVLLWSPLWALMALLIIAPWIAPILWRACGRNTETMRNSREPEFYNLFGRWASAVFIAGSLVGLELAEFCTFNPYAAGERHGGYFTNIFVVTLLCILSAMLIAPEIATLASSGFTGFIDAVFFPGGREKLPPYTLKLARFYVEKQRWDDAEAEYARMLSFYPDQPEAWQERLALAFRRAAPADPAPAEVLAAAFKALSKLTDREMLHHRFTELTE